MQNRLIKFGLVEKYKDRYDDLVAAIQEKFNRK